MSTTVLCDFCGKPIHTTWHCGRLALVRGSSSHRIVEWDLHPDCEDRATVMIMAAMKEAAKEARETASPPRPAPVTTERSDQ